MAGLKVAVIAMVVIPFNMLCRALRSGVDVFGGYAAGELQAWFIVDAGRMVRALGSLEVLGCQVIDRV